MISAGPTTQPTRQPIRRSSFEAEPTVIVRWANPGWASRVVRGGPAVEPDSFHRRVVHHPDNPARPGRARRRARPSARRPGARRWASPGPSPARPRCSAPGTAAAERLGVGDPAVGARHARYVAWDAPGQADAVEQPDVDRVAVTTGCRARAARAGSQDPAEPTDGDEALAAGRVGPASPPTCAAAAREVDLAEEGEIAVASSSPPRAGWPPGRRRAAGRRCRGSPGAASRDRPGRPRRRPPGRPRCPARRGAGSPARVEVERCGRRRNRGQMGSGVIAGLR